MVRRLCRHVAPPVVLGRSAVKDLGTMARSRSLPIRQVQRAERMLLAGEAAHCECPVSIGLPTGKHRCLAGMLCLKDAESRAPGSSQRSRKENVVGNHRLAY